MFEDFPGTQFSSFITNSFVVLLPNAGVAACPNESQTRDPVASGK